MQQNVGKLQQKLVLTALNIILGMIIQYYCILVILVFIKNQLHQFDM